MIEYTYTMNEFDLLLMNVYAWEEMMPIYKFKSMLVWQSNFTQPNHISVDCLWANRLFYRWLNYYHPAQILSLKCDLQTI